jgi:hypothetical protein
MLWAMDEEALQMLSIVKAIKSSVVLCRVMLYFNLTDKSFK